MKPAAVFFFLCTLAAPSPACEGLDAAGAWVRMPPPGMTMTAGYARLANHSATPLTITSAASDVFGSVTLHRTVDEDGVSRMRPALPLTIDPGAERVLQPGGYHLMLSKPGRELRPDDRIMIEFRCEERSTQLPFTVAVDPP